MANRRKDQDKVFEDKQPIYSSLDNHRYETSPSLNNAVYQPIDKDPVQYVDAISDRNDNTNDDYYFYDHEENAQRPSIEEAKVDNYQVSDGRLDVDYEYYTEDKDYDYDYDYEDTEENDEKSNDYE